MNFYGLKQVQDSVMTYKKGHLFCQDEQGHVSFT